MDSAIRQLHIIGGAGMKAEDEALQATDVKRMKAGEIGGQGMEAVVGAESSPRGCSLGQPLARAEQSLRRRIRRAHLGRDMQDQPAQVALVANLRQSVYVHLLLCGTLARLPLAFARLEHPPANKQAPVA